jgi:hypothetical protein
LRATKLVTVLAAPEAALTTLPAACSTVLAAPESAFPIAFAVPDAAWPAAFRTFALSRAIGTLRSVTGPGNGAIAAATTSALPCAVAGRCAAVAVASGLGIGALGTAELALGYAHVLIAPSVLGDLILLPFDFAAPGGSLLLVGLISRVLAIRQNRPPTIGLKPAT